jgi:DNA-binding NtrC family response regulator/predicted hydrocarbon binding protein
MSGPAWTARDAAAAADVQLADLLDFQPNPGVIRLHDQRVVILSAAAMGLLRKDLIDTLGANAARRLLLRFGYADGYHDAATMRDRSAFNSPLDVLKAGATLHTLEGIVNAVPLSVEYDEATSRFESTARWTDSYEAEQHRNHCGISATPVCWTLVGYASGYASACLGREVFFRETKCVGTGEDECLIVGKDAESWRDELDALRSDFQGRELGNEVDRLREAARVHQLGLERRERRLARRERELDMLRERVVAHAASNRFVVRGAALQEVLEHAERVAPLETTVLVRGESGTGKEFIVKMIHEHSSRSRGSLVSVNCAALTETLLESELFGHVRGAFTGAVRDKPGLFEVASAGTLFLDEIGEMALSLQAKLLRALQEGEIRRVGGERSITVTPRVIAATNRDLRAAVAAGAFREDLYFRLGAFVITVPPLRERRESIPPLAHEFLRRAAAQFNKDVRVIAPEAMTRLVGYRWPGNVRELEHAIERAVILAPDAVISVQELPPEVLEPDQPRLDESLDLELHERTLIRRALVRFHGNRRRAAEALRISTVTLWRKMTRYNLTSDTSDR